MPIKTTLTFYLAPVRMTVIKKANDIECWWECAEAVLILTAVGNMNWRSCYGWFEGSSEAKIPRPVRPALWAALRAAERMPSEQWGLGNGFI